MKNNFLFFFFWGLLCYAVASSAQPFNKQKMDSLFDVLQEKNKAMGSLVLSKNGKVIYERAIGNRFISADTSMPATTDTKYRIGSITKMFTAVMIFQLIEEGKLTLRTTMDHYFPKLPNASSITVGSLLNHRSGLHNFTQRADYEAWAVVPKKQKEMMKIIAAGGSDFTPGTKAVYSNSNYYVLGYLIEKVTKQSYAKNLQERITSKIGLTNTYVGGKTNVKKNESYSYQFINNQWLPKTETSITVTGGAGCLVSTPLDLTKFIDALFTMKLVDENSLAQMKTMNDGYGMGILLLPFETKKAYGHTGGIDGFASVVNYFTKDSLAVAYCSNGQVYSRNDILTGVLSIYYHLNYTIPDFAFFPVDTTLLETYVGVYANKDNPLKITITRTDSLLTAQATGQPSFPLEATSETKFKFDPARVVIIFNTEKKELILKQHGGVYVFLKE